MQIIAGGHPLPEFIMGVAGILGFPSLASSYQNLLSPQAKSRAEPRMAERRRAMDGPYGGHPSTLYGEEVSLGRRERLELLNISSP